MTVLMRNIMKFFPENGAKALEGADLCIRTGEIHALLGENGAGKSSLMQILAGSLLPDSGEIFIDGAPVHFTTPAAALNAGIGIVRQRPALIHGLPLWQDCILGRRHVHSGFFHLFLPYKKRAREFVRATADEYGIGLPLDAESGSLSAGERQMAGVLALLLRNTRFLIFDEATAVLDEADSERLFALWRRLAASGRGVVLISHKLEEVFALANSVTVLRKGKTAATLPAAECNEEMLIALMFGSGATGAFHPAFTMERAIFPQEDFGRRVPVALHPAFTTERAILPQEDFGCRVPVALHPAFTMERAIPPQEDFGRRVPVALHPAFTMERAIFAPSRGVAGRRVPDTVLAVKNLTVRDPGFPFLRDISFSVRRGEILGVAGVKESGVETLELALSRFINGVSGSIELDGRDIARGDTGAFRAAGGAYLGAGRHTLASGRGVASLDRNLSIRDNLLIHAYGRLGKSGLAGKIGIQSGKKTRDWVGRVMAESALLTKPRAKAMTLSGGMLQRMLGVREFAENPAFIIMVEPTWGLDYQRRERFFRFLWEKTGHGCAALLFCSDLDELLGICDRILVLHGGECAALLTNDAQARPENAKILKKKIKNALAGLP
jgi:ABC-type uncharacterized transport system ATPase subunit